MIAFYEAPWCPPKACFAADQSTMSRVLENEAPDHDLTAGLILGQMWHGTRENVPSLGVHKGAYDARVFIFLIFIRLLSILLNKYPHRALEGDQIDLNAWLGPLTYVSFSIRVLF